MVGLLLIIGGIIYLIYKVAEEKSWDNCKAKDVDNIKMICDAQNISRKELQKRYKSGYYNKK